MPTRDARTSVDKAMAVLLAFGDGHVVGVSEVARRTGLPKSTAFRLLGMLERNGAVERSGSSYRLGRTILGLGDTGATPEHDLVRDVLTPFLAELFTSTRQTAHLAVLSGVDVIYLNKLYGYRPVRSPSRTGGRAPAYCTAVGKALLAHEPATAQMALSTSLIGWTKHTITDPEALRTELAMIQARGVAFDREEILTGLTCVAAPVFGMDGSVAAALSVSGAVETFRPQDAVPVLRAMATRAGQALSRVQQLRQRQQQGGPEL